MKSEMLIQFEQKNGGVATLDIEAAIKYFAISDYENNREMLAKEFSITPETANEIRALALKVS